MYAETQDEKGASAVEGFPGDGVKDPDAEPQWARGACTCVKRPGGPRKLEGRPRVQGGVRAERGLPLSL